jgi:phage terminase Nu1 subunit (DNA packaging protein)
MKREYEPTQQKAALALGVDRRTLREWLDRGAPDKGEHGYDIESIRNWHSLNVRSDQSSGDDSDLNEEQQGLKARYELARVLKVEGEARKVAAEAEIKEFTAQQTTQDVVHLDDVEQFMALFFGEFRRVLMRIPKEMKNGYPESIRRDLEEDLEGRLGIALRTASGYARRLSDLRRDGVENSGGGS